MVAIVAIIGGILNFEIKSPLNAPSAIPIPDAISNAEIIFPPNLRQTTAMTYSAIVAVAANEISIPPDIRTNKIPIASTPIKE